MVDTLGTGKTDDDKIAEAAQKVFDVRPGMIIKNLDLLRPIHGKTACYGHFGRTRTSLGRELTRKRHPQRGWASCEGLLDGRGPQWPWVGA